MNTSRYPHLIEEIGHILSGKVKLPVTLPLNDGTGMSLSLSDNMQGTWQAKYSVPVNGYVYGLPVGTRHIRSAGTPTSLLEQAFSGLQDARQNAIGLFQAGMKDAYDPSFSGLTDKDADVCAAALRECVSLYRGDEQDRITAYIKNASSLLAAGPSFPVRIPLHGGLGLRIERSSTEGQFAVFAEGKEIGIISQIGTFPESGDVEEYVAGITACSNSVPAQIEAVRKALVERHAAFAKEADTARQRANHCTDLMDAAEQYRAIFRKEDDKHD